MSDSDRRTEDTFEVKAERGDYRQIIEGHRGNPKQGSITCHPRIPCSRRIR
jgi:hypothetical protein